MSGADEIWKAIPGFEGKYEASSAGRVRSLSWFVERPQGGYWKRGSVLQPWRNVQNGREYVNLSGSTRTTVYRLVALAFLGTPTSDDLYVCHRDGDYLNNNVANLYWGTPHENSMDKRRHGTDHQVNKTSCPLGHPLELPNLVAWNWNNFGHRVCRACARARAYLQCNPGDFQTVANGKYVAQLKDPKSFDAYTRTAVAS